MKRVFLNAMMILAVAVAAGFVSCDKEDDKDKKDLELTGDFEQLASTGLLRGDLSKSFALEAKEYELIGPVIVKEGGELTIPAGTVIKAQEGFSSYILVLQGGKIFVNGTAEKPVRMTSVSSKKSGAWGGLIINGRAPLSGGETGTTEINSAYQYGGADAADNSGVLTYLSIEYAGARSSADVEHNGLTLNGVGNGTKIENIYILESADDGIEFFGGSVDVTNLLVVNSDDDMFDFTQGYTGTLKNCYGIWEADYSSTEDDPRGIEADGNLDGKNPDQQGQSDFRVENMTIDLQLAPVASDDKNKKFLTMQDVIKVRRGAKATVVNALVKGTGSFDNLVDFKDGKGTANAASSISITNKLTAEPFKALLEGATTEQVKIVDGNTGCDNSIFGWTGYKNF